MPSLRDADATMASDLSDGLAGDRNDKSDDKLALIVKAIEETIAENKAECNDTMELLGKRLGIEPKNMLNYVPRDSSDTDEASSKLAAERVKRATAKRARDRRRLDITYDSLSHRHASIPERLDEAEAAVETLRRVVRVAASKNEQEYANRIFMARKIKDYARSAIRLDESTTEMGVAASCVYEIPEKYDAYLALTKELTEADESASKYGELPINLSEARRVVRETEGYLTRLDQALYEKMQK